MLIISLNEDQRGLNLFSDRVVRNLDNLLKNGKFENESENYKLISGIFDYL